jgi:hypothetical protein
VANRREAPHPLLVFIHIPKTAGTTLEVLLRHHYGEAFTRIETVEADDADHLRECVKQTLDNPHVQVTQGHIPFGLRDLFPAGTRYATVLRDPIERMLSRYHRMMIRSQAPRNGRLWPPSRDLSLADCLRRGYLRDNLQTRMLCGLVSAVDELPPGALDQATRNLAERFAYVGTTERFDAFLALLNVELGWPTVAYRSSHTSPGRMRSGDLSVDDLRLLEESNLLDRQLHAYAGELFAEAFERAGPEVELELEVIERARALRPVRRADSTPEAFRLRSLPSRRVSSWP